MYSKTGKNAWSWTLIILIGLVIGGFIGHYLGGVSFLSWLAYGLTFGMDAPVSLDLGIIKLQFGLMLEFNICGILGVILAIFLYRRA